MQKIIRCAIFFFTIIYSQFSRAQFSHADTLRGSYGEGRSWWDVTKYDLYVQFNLEDGSISGHNIISLNVLEKEKVMQIDLQEPLKIDSISYVLNSNYKGRINNTDILKRGNAWFIPARYFSIPNTDHPKVLLTVYYHGKPLIALNPPWSGGLTLTRDNNNNPWATITCQATGASVWYPCKDHQSDEPDSAELHITAPTGLVCVGNGKLRGKMINADGTTTYSWAVVNPINNYNLIPSIGKYVNFNEVYKGEKGNLNMNYWVLDYNLEKAKKQFADARRMMKAFEYWFGPYPFYEDGYKLVESPHLGMEHQSGIAYGNGYANGCLGRGDLSHTGWGLKWDYIIVHESGHEWFGNNITTKDIADMWVHEGFTTYSEALFTEYYYGKKAGSEYVAGLRKTIKNDVPVIGPYGVNKEGSNDMYYKGANMLHTIRQAINNDEKFRDILRGLNATFYHQTVTTKQVEDYMIKNSGIDLSTVFDEYLRTTMIPTLEYKVVDYTLRYRWTNVVKGFKMPLKINFKGERWIKPTEQWQTLSLYPEGKPDLVVDNNFYINTRKVI